MVDIDTAVENWTEWLYDNYIGGDPYREEPTDEELEAAAVDRYEDMLMDEGLYYD